VPMTKKAAIRRCAAKPASKPRVVPPARKKGGRAPSAKAAECIDTVPLKMLGDSTVAGALADILHIHKSCSVYLMESWRKPLLKASIPGLHSRRLPSKAMLATAKSTVLRFLDREESHGRYSHVYEAFLLASGEDDLMLEWGFAKQRVRRAKLDCRGRFSCWKDCFAMVNGPSQATTEMFICGTRKLTLRALTSLICHEALHNLARRRRRGNPFISEEKEHVAMALLGDPQLVEKRLC